MNKLLASLLKAAQMPFLKMAKVAIRKIHAGVCGLLLLAFMPTLSYADTGTKFEIESLFPMYFYGGRHLAVGVRVDDVRIRASCIDGGRYDYEPDNPTFERNLGTGCGAFLGYFFAPNWEIYLFVEKQNYVVRNRANMATQRFDVIDIGPGIGYQYFFDENIYIQPAVHLYWRPSQKGVIGGTNYLLRETDLSAVVRLGYQF